MFEAVFSSPFIIVYPVFHFFAFFSFFRIFTFFSVELDIVLKVLFCHGVLVTVIYAGQKMLILLIFISFAMTGGRMSASVVFPVMAWLYILRGTLFSRMLSTHRDICQLAACLGRLEVGPATCEVNGQGYFS